MIYFTTPNCIDSCQDGYQTCGYGDDERIEEWEKSIMQNSEAVPKQLKFNLPAPELPSTHQALVHPLAPCPPNVDSPPAPLYYHAQPQVKKRKVSPEVPEVPESEKKTRFYTFLAHQGPVQEVDEAICGLLRNELTNLKLFPGLIDAKLEDITWYHTRDLDSLTVAGMVTPGTAAFLENMKAILFCVINSSRHLKVKNKVDVEDKDDYEIKHTIYPLQVYANFLRNSLSPVFQKGKEPSESFTTKVNNGGRTLIWLVYLYGIEVLLFPSHFHWSQLGNLSQADTKEIVLYNNGIRKPLSTLLFPFQSAALSESKNK
ncbi:hypothetical protein O0I10_010834 [Lichtheimia ornata]|uniref:Uncharacterized protein n=1 Tax=Lichtheimia ornata TaxID=688661 RepID=A0AAD7UUV1_9FUNG|nr:uncharacterized protein O0I10_010834 [Lichtheimia ornata]KAJ8653506.1 hypothetical protein O0I10_010834 [Lichtheimia ornata]